jgi:tetratricopeptide (TPR) repeat protein
MRPAADSHSLNARLLRFRSDPDQEDAHALAEDLIDARRYGDARGVAVSAQTDDERLDARLLVLEARAWYLDRDLVRAQAALVRAARLDPDAHEVFRWLGEVLLQRGDPLRAVRALERALALEPGDADTQHLFERASELAQNAEPLPSSNPPVASSPLPPPRERPVGVRAPAPGPTEQASIRPRPVRPSFEPQRAPAARGSLSSTANGATAAGDRMDEETTHSYRRERERVRPIAASEGFDDMSDGALDDPESTTSNNVTAQGRTAPGRTAPGAISSPGRSAPGRSAPGNVAGRSVPGTLRGHSTPAAQSAPGVPAPNPASWSGNPTPLSALAAPPPLRSSPGISSAPGRTAPGTGSAPGRTAPGVSSASGRTAPGAISSPGIGSSPGISSASGRLSAPQRTPSSPGAGSSPGTSASPSSGAGRIASPMPSSSSGRLSAPSAAGAAAPFSASSGGWVDGVGSGRGNGSAGHPHVAHELDVDVDVDEPGAREATPQPPLEAPLFNQGRPIAASWDAPSVMAPWPLASDLAEQTEGEGLPLQAFGTARTEPMLDAGADLELGASAGQADDPEQVLAMLRDHGVFETTEARPSIWPPKKDVPRTGTRLRGALLFAWLSAIVLCGGGYFGWTQWVQVRHQKAADLTAQAKVAAFNSDYATLIDAERLLRGARELYPRSKEVPQLELFVHAARVLENGNRDLSTLRAALARAGVPALGVDAAHLAAARAVLAAYSSTSAEAAGMLDQARKLRGDQPELLYLVGRIEQRLGRPEADADLQAAAAKAPDLVAASLALAEEARDKGDEAGARAKLDAVLQRHPDHLRTRLWNAMLTADEQEPTTALAALQKLDEPAKLGAPVDRVLWGLSRARLSARAGQNDKAAEALRDALGAGASEPRLLALIAAEALRGDQLGTAQQAASQALALAPSAVTYRVLLARVLLARNDGSRVLDLIAQVPDGTPGLWTMRARAALQTGQNEAITAALAAQPAQADQGLEQQALRLRLRSAVEPSSKLLSDAKSMLKRAPGDPEALRAVAEVALAQHQPSDATNASQQLIALMPEDAEGYHWLGRARRMAADAEGSERALRKALELSPGYDGALITLGGLLLDTGKYAEADPIYEQLGRSYALSGRLGRAEALLGLGRVDDAAVQLSGLSEELRNTSQARETAAKVAIAQGKAGDAVALLRPLLDGENKHASALALYGDALYAVDQVNSAAGAYDAALAVDSTLPEARLGRAETYLRAEKPKDALEQLDKVKATIGDRLRPPSLRARMLMQYGHAYVQRDKRDDLEHARDMLREAVKIPGAPAEAFFWLGEALGGRKTPEAASALKHYLELAPKGAYAERARRSLGPLL